MRAQKENINRRGSQKKSKSPTKSKDHSRPLTDTKVKGNFKLTEEEILLIKNSRASLQTKPNFFIPSFSNNEEPFGYFVSQNPKEDSPNEKLPEKPPEVYHKGTKVIGLGLDQINLKKIEEDIDEMCVKICNNDTDIDVQTQELRAMYSAIIQKEEKIKNLGKNLFSSFAAIEKSKGFIKQTQSYLNNAEEYYGNATKEKKPMVEKVVELEIENENLKKKLLRYTGEEGAEGGSEQRELRQLREENKILKTKNNVYEKAFDVQEEKITHLEERVKQLLSFLGQK